MPTANRAKIKLTAEQRRALRDQPEPSAKSLALVPEIRGAEYMGRGPEGLRAAIEYSRAQRGRPKKGEASGGSSV